MKIFNSAGLRSLSAGLSVIGMVLLFLFLLLLLLCCLSSFPSVLSGPPVLPYLSPDSLPGRVFVVRFDGRPDADRLVLTSLQGTLSQQSLHSAHPVLLYRTIGNGSGSDENNDSQHYFLSSYRRDPLYRETVFNDSLRDAPLRTILNTFHPLYSSFLLCEIGERGESDSVNIALSLSGLHNDSLVVTSLHLPLMEELGLTMRRNLTGVSEAEFFGGFRPIRPDGPEWPFNRHFYSCQSSGKSVAWLSDLSVFYGAAHFHHIPTFNLIIPTYSNGTSFAFFGWTADNQSENGMTLAVTQMGGWVLAADWLSNGATHAYFSAPTQQGRRSMVNPTRARTSNIDNRGKHVVAFLWSDGDSLCADLDGAVARTRFLSPQRGLVPQTWSLNPSLSRFAPSALQWFYDQAKTNDSFIGFAPGYAYSESFPTGASRWSWAANAGEVMASADMRVDLMIGFNFTESAFEPLLANYNCDGLIYFIYPNYYVLPDGHNGTIMFVHDKPVISIRDSLWDGHSTPESVAAMLNGMPTDRTQSTAYSVIGIHMWSQTVETVNHLASLLNEDVIVVKVDELVSLVNTHVARTLPSSSASQSTKQPPAFFTNTIRV